MRVQPRWIVVLALVLLVSGCCAPSETVVRWHEVPVLIEPIEVHGLPVNTPNVVHNAQVDSVLDVWERDIAKREAKPVEQVRRRTYGARRITELGDTVNAQFVLDREPRFDIAVRYGPRKVGYHDTTTYRPSITRTEKWGFRAEGALLLLGAVVVAVASIFGVRLFTGRLK